VHRRGISSFRSHSMAGAAGTQRFTVAVPWPRGPPRSSLLRGPEARLGPIASYCSCAGAPRADGRRSTAAAGRRGRPRRSWGLPPLACVCGEAKLGDNSLSLSLSPSMSNVENAIFFVLLFFVLLHAKCLTGCLILMLHFLHFILLLSTFPSPVIK